MTESLLEAKSRLSMLQAYLLHDPNNIELLTDTAWAAYEAEDHELAGALLAQLQACGPLPARARNLALNLAIGADRLEDAAVLADGLLADDPDDPHLRFSRAWIYARQGRFAAADRLLSKAVATASPQARALKVHLLHHLGDLDEALTWGEEAATLYPLDEAFAGSMALAAMDADRPELAKSYAQRGGSDGSARIVRGLFALDAGHAADALEAFDAVLQAGPQPRALVGRGLALLHRGETDAAVADLAAAAALFEDHLGTWVALGWAELLRGQRDEARAAFEQAVRLDRNFSEGHGGLAVIAVLNGDIADAAARAKVAERLDRAGMGAMLAKLLLAADRRDDQAAAQILRHALSRPVGPRGRTLAQALALSGRAGAQ